MDFVRKSILRKLASILALYCLAFGALVYALAERTPLSPTVLLIGGIAVFAVGFGVVFYLFYYRPLKKILLEMQALLAGNAYRRIFTDRVDEIGILAHFFNQVTKSFGEVSHDIKDRQRILGELSTAKQLQQDILPRENPEVPGLEIIAKTKPASELGGDSYNFVTVHGKTFWYVGDVTGHGVAAGLIMTMVSSLITVFAEIYDSPYEILVHVNKHIKKHVKQAMFMTLVMFAFDHKTGQMSFVGAGHEHILVYRAASGQCESILSGGVALGMVPDNSKIIRETALELAVGDVIVVYTDGITESKNAAGEMYGLERLIAAVAEYAPQYSAEGVNYHVARDNAAFAAGNQEDDATLIVVKKV